MNSIPRIRYDVLAGYSRSPHAVLSSEELCRFEETVERVLGVPIERVAGKQYVNTIGFVAALHGLTPMAWPGENAVGADGGRSGRRLPTVAVA
jgi:hypothetical protein